jgi:two-component system, cell cycle response regulator DivK
MAGELILIVEDNEKNRKLERDILQFHGYRTVEADTAEEGNSAGPGNATRPRPHGLPGMNGIDALHHLRGDPRTRAIPVIAVTASVMTQDRQKIMAAGFDGYQAKPIEVTQFVAAVRDAAGHPQRGILHDGADSPMAGPAIAREGRATISGFTPCHLPIPA